MDLIERTWEGVGNFFGGIMHRFERGVTAMFGSSNARYIRKLQARVEAINSLEPNYQAMSDEELRAQTQKFRDRLKAGETLDDLLIEAFAVCREGGRRFLGMRHFDVQLIGGMVLHSGAIAEMMTGEGKTLVATLPAYLNALEGKGVHVVTVNDYLARRDMEWMGPLYMSLGLTVGNIQSNMEVLDRQQAYACDITYGTNNELGFDYLRDNMRPAARGDHRFPSERQQSQGELNFAIIDEVDNILIDEARTPLIISGSSNDNPRKYGDADRIARVLQKDKHFTVNEKDHSVNLTDDGVREAERLAGVDSFYTSGNMEWPHLIDNALKAHYLYQRDVRYVVEEGQVVIVDEHTGRKMDGRQWSDGLHQAVEAKEGVRIKEETQTLATVTLQNFFKLYNKVGGMTGTAMTEASEFWKIYHLDVIAIPGNKKLLRIEHPDVIYRTEREKFIAVADEIERVHKYDCLVIRGADDKVGTIEKETDEWVDLRIAGGKEIERVEKDKIREIQRKGRPVLAGTVSIEKSERLSALLDKRGIKHEVLNAKFHKREAEIVAQAGRLGAVTIATNMAGRGTDIILGGNPETMAWALLQNKYKTRLDVPEQEWDTLVREIEQREGMKAEGEVVRGLGGLHVIGTERHDARRIDLQLRGRCGRQGDPGSSRFFLSLEDDLMRIFAGPWVKTILDSLGMQEGERIESRMVSRRIEAAQKKVEERHFEARKNLLEYDEVMDEQRKRVYGFRQDILEGKNCREVILDMIRKQIDDHLKDFLHRDFGPGRFAAWAGPLLSCEFQAKDFRGSDFVAAESYARDQAERMAETHVQDAIDENLPLAGEEDSDIESDWNWTAMARMAQSRWNADIREADLKRVGRDAVGEYLLGFARKSIEDLDLDPGKQFLEEDYGIRHTCSWVKQKFGITIDFDEVRKQDAATIKRKILELAENAYDLREAEYPVMAAYYNFQQGANGVNLEALIQWANARFPGSISMEELQGKQGNEITAALVKLSQGAQEKADEKIAATQKKLQDVLGNAESQKLVRQIIGTNGQLTSLGDWLKDELRLYLSTDELGMLTRESLELKAFSAIEDMYRPEIRRMERLLLLQIVDNGWKEHLLAMDRLRSAVGLVSYAQVDPKVEYKREGMKLFEEMWKSINNQVTDLVFKMESLDEEFVGSTWHETSARHDEPVAATQEFEAGQRAQESAASGDSDAKPRPIRNLSPRLGRNDPCYCGSGKKYKNCCMRRDRSSV